MTTSSIFGAGAYSPCTGALPAGENYDPLTAKFFYNHPDLKWVPTLPSQAASVPGVVQVGSLYIARKYMLAKNGTYHQVGKIDLGVFRYKIPGKITEATFTGEVEVLACGACTGGGTGPFCCTNGANNKDCNLNPPCGTLMSFPRNDPRVDGFESGTYITGETVYPGTADMTACLAFNPSPARIAFNGNSGAGAYMGCAGYGYEFYDDVNPQYYRDHPDLKWIPVNSTYALTAVPGVIRLTPFVFIPAKIRVRMNNGTFTIMGKVYGGVFYYYQPGNALETAAVMDVEVLACQPCTNGGTGPYCCLNGVNNRFCCENGANNRYCCANEANNPYCCLNGANNPSCTLTFTCGATLPMNGTYRADDTTYPGFASGVWADGSTIYPGTGNFSIVLCSYYNPGIALIRMNSPLGPGAYQSFGAAPNCFDGTYAQYFVKTPNMEWKFTNSVQLPLLTNTLQVNGWKVGRVNVTMTNGTVYQSIGRITGITMYYYKQGDTAETVYTGPYDVLVCN
jgi:hypothetical protein